MRGALGRRAAQRGSLKPTTPSIVWPPKEWPILSRLRLSLFEQG
jgi:hypothetical protein